MNNKNNSPKKTEIAAAFISDFLKRCSNENNKVVVDYYLYLAASLTGISCAVAAKQEFAANNINSNGTNNSLAVIETESGNFFYGDILNDLLYESNDSVWSMICEANKTSNLPDIQKIINDTAKKIGKKDAKVWNEQHDPYEEVNHARKAYDHICGQLKTLDISALEMKIAFSNALISIIGEVSKFFPSEVNCIELALDTICFYAHMDVDN